jgi:DNA-binding LacI/PurR family transcriptional regulator
VTATIADVARRAGVSTATVSRVLTGLGPVRPETRGRVLAAARDLGYRPSAVARSLKRRSTETLGLIVTDIENPYFPQLVKAVEDAAIDLGYAVLLCNATDDRERELAYLDLLVERRVDGLIVAASNLGVRHAAWLADPPLPVVLINAAAPGSARVPAIASDNRDGGRQAADHLLGLGHRQLGYLMPPPRNADAPERLAGVREALAAAGLDSAAALVVVDGRSSLVGGGEAAMTELLDRAASTTGVIAYNDLMAIGAMRAVRTTGRHVPQDVSVVGFDDLAVAAYVDPPLTTVAQATTEMGRWAVERLVRDLRQPADVTSDRAAVTPSAVNTRLPVRLIVRGSTGPAPASESSPTASGPPATPAGRRPTRSSRPARRASAPRPGGPARGPGGR